MRRVASSHSIDDFGEDLDSFVTLSSFILTATEVCPSLAAKGHIKKEEETDLCILLQSIATSCKYIQNCVRKLGLANLSGKNGGTTNVQGEQQMKLDVIAHDVFTRGLDESKRCTMLISEEEEEAIMCTSSPNGRYVCVFDPLDGSSNIDCCVSVGSIFGVYRANALGKGDVNDVLRPGKEMVAAGYCMYGSACTMVLTVGGNVRGFTLDPSLGEFVLTHPKIKCPPSGATYSVNEGNSRYWGGGMRRYVDHVKYHKEKPHALRYIGSMVADVHRTLLYGGTFSYPGDSKSPNGKLRLLYECFPMAYIMERAGGAASDGTQRILDVCCTGIHQRHPIHMGSEEDVEEIDQFYREAAADRDAR